MPSPCDGYAISEADALKIAARKARLRVVKIEKAELGVKLLATEKRLAAQATACTKRVDACDVQVAGLEARLTDTGGQARETPLVERAWFVATIAIIVTAAIAVPVTWLAVTEASRL